MPRVHRITCTGSVEEAAARLAFVLKERHGIHGRLWREGNPVEVRFEVQEFAALRYGLNPYALGAIRQTESGCQAEFTLRFSRFAQVSMALIAVIALALLLAGVSGFFPADPVLLLGGSAVLLCIVAVNTTLPLFSRGDLYNLLEQYLKG